MRRRARVLAALTAAMLALGLGACGGDDAEDADDTEAADTAGAGEGAGRDTTTTTEPPTPEELAVAAYRAHWEATMRAMDPPTELPEIAETTTGQALSERLNGINRRARLGHRVEGTVEVDPQVVSVTGSEILLDDCAVENSVEYDANGGVVDTAEDAAYGWRVTMVDEDGTWKVAMFEQREEACAGR